jgi:predicted unusual protein kinase regulating ubiquinone biosynthesis (AarF/ABC1/UbiB family)
MFILYVLNGFFFTFQVFTIFLRELILYYIFDNYPVFIINITNNLAKINILYIKIFQAFALNNKITDEILNKQLVKFTDKSPWTLSDINIDILDRLVLDENIILDGNNILDGNIILDRNIILDGNNILDENIILDGNNDYIHSGMISLVYKGTYKNKKIVIKMKRTNIQENLMTAINNLIFFIQFVSFFYPSFNTFIEQYKVKDLIERNKNMIMEQVDFKKEVENMIKMKESCKGMKYIKIPQVYPYFTEKYQDVIIMECMDGIKIQDILEEDYDSFANILLKFGFITSLVHGFAHGDLHPGNILFIKDCNIDEKCRYKLGILDFGIMYQINDYYKNIVLEITCDLFTSPVEKTAIKILETGLIIQPLSVIEKLSDVQRQKILNIFIFALKECIIEKKQINQVRLYEFIHNLHSYLENSDLHSLGLYLSDDFVKTQLVIGMVHGIVMKLCKDNYREIAEKVIQELFYTDLLSE